MLQFSITERESNCSDADTKNETVWHADDDDEEDDTDWFMGAISNNERMNKEIETMRYWFDK